jgi:hypothetical protein
MLPKRREKPRSGIERAPKREWPRHRRFVRGHKCSNPHCYSPLAAVQFAHVRHETDGGTGVKPSDWWGISLCAHCHKWQHDIGEPAFERFTGLNLKKLAMEFARNSPDTAMREAMKELGLL